jgi:hypothetical protein
MISMISSPVIIGWRAPAVVGVIMIGRRIPPAVPMAVMMPSVPAVPSSPLAITPVIPIAKAYVDAGTRIVIRIIEERIIVIEADITRVIKTKSGIRPVKTTDP